jgi:hypothetical protein
MASDGTEPVVTVTGDQRRVSEAERQHLARQGPMLIAKPYSAVSEPYMTPM